MKKLVSLILVAAMALSLCAFAHAEDPVELVFAYDILSAGSIADMDKVEAAINDITIPEIGVKLKILPIQSSAYEQQLTLMLTSQEPLDIIYTFGNSLSNYVTSEKIVPMTALLDEYGQGIKELLGDYLAATTVNGDVYAIPTIRDICRGIGFIYDATVAEECNLDMSQVKQLSDLTAIFEQIQAVKGKDFPCLISSGQTILTNYIVVDQLNDSNGVLLNCGLTDTNVTFWEASDTYKELVTQFNEWFKAGYVQKDIVITQDDKYSTLRQGIGFCYPSNCKPGITNTASRSVGREMKVLVLGDYFATTQQTANFNFSIAQGCIDEVKAMQFLNMLYTDSRVATLLGCGIEGLHYQKLENGQIAFPEGIDSNNTTYFPNVTWAVGNQFLTPTWSNDPIDLWEQQDAANKSAKKSLALGFTFNNANVAAEVSAVANVRSQYQKQIENGDCDLDTLLPEYIQALRDAGIETIIAEKQAQLDAWLASK